MTRDCSSYATPSNRLISPFVYIFHRIIVCVRERDWAEGEIFDDRREIERGAFSLVLLSHLFLMGANEEQRAYCHRLFPKIWSRFVTAVTESCHARGSWCGEVEPAVGCDADGSRIPRPPTRLGKVDKIVSIGDVHGDVHKAKRAFRLAGLKIGRAHV